MGHDGRVHEIGRRKNQRKRKIKIPEWCSPTICRVNCCWVDFLAFASKSESNTQLRAPNLTLILFIMIFRMWFPPAAERQANTYDAGMCAMMTQHNITQGTFCHWQNNVASFFLFSFVNFPWKFRMGVCVWALVYLSTRRVCRLAVICWEFRAFLLSINNICLVSIHFCWNNDVDIMLTERKIGCL